MWWKTVNGTMDAEVERVLKSNGVRRARPRPPPPSPDAN